MIWPSNSIRRGDMLAILHSPKMPYTSRQYLTLRWACAHDHEGTELHSFCSCGNVSGSDFSCMTNSTILVFPCFQSIHVRPSIDSSSFTLAAFVPQRHKVLRSKHKVE